MESAVNTPHPDDIDEAAAFFGGDPEPVPEPEAPDFDHDPERQRAEAEAYRESHGEPVSDSTQSAEETVALREHEERQAKLREIAERERAEAEAKTERGSIEREYIIFQKVPLTTKVLRHLLDQLESGDEPEARTAYIELHRVTARNDKSAVAEAYAQHKDSLGEACDLAATTSRGFKVRHVEPKRVITTSRISIT